ncbi:hypothetical protein KIH27_17730 [Mycobacterium sp. M1]|uniref:Bacterial Ig domain-containing protein n=2 Tax=Mycolicibacter acidiphilus TaxID=2835306 RepID=A0ABS5RM91_9MYCO|nr:hypothetical protein [Mycolicibacter acidiphilus]
MGAAGNGPTITARAMTPQLLVTGRGFLPGSEVTIRMIGPDGTSTFVQQDADRSGALAIGIPAPTPHGSLCISATDSLPDPDDETGVRWTNTDTVAW